MLYSKAEWVRYIFARDPAFATVTATVNCATFANWRRTRHERDDACNLRNAYTYTKQPSEEKQINWVILNFARRLRPQQRYQKKKEANTRTKRKDKQSKTPSKRRSAVREIFWHVAKKKEKKKLSQLESAAVRYFGVAIFRLNNELSIEVLFDGESCCRTTRSFGVGGRGCKGGSRGF